MFAVQRSGIAVTRCVWTLRILRMDTVWPVAAYGRLLSTRLPGLHNCLLLRQFARAHARALHALPLAARAAPRLTPYSLFDTLPYLCQRFPC